MGLLRLHDDGAYPEGTSKTPTPPMPPSGASFDPVYVGTLRQWMVHQGVSLPTVRSWIRSGVLAPTDGFERPSVPQSVGLKDPLVLSPLQQDALQEMVQMLHNQSTILLEGITGSGKTEVILALCKEIWAHKKQVLVLLPEIMLAYPWQQRVAQYFDMTPTLWHSAMTPRLRQEAMESITLGTSLLVIGARSALCLPYADLGLIVVDEEHESAYKQTDSVCYHGRDMAILRGKKQNIPVILASATPAIETRWNVQNKRYGHVRMHHRYGLAQLPDFSCIDMRPHPPKDHAWISPALRQHLQETLDKGEQSLLFLNRRGYACLWMCYRCGYRAACIQCSTWLSVHAHPKKLLCHYCGYQLPIPKQCPGCGDDQGVLLMGPGIERIAQEVASLFPLARTVLLSSDHVTSSTQMKGVLDQITQRQVDILIGTQLIAKGYHFPYLTCIGIVDTDFALTDMDFRASERLFQLLYQVAGRAGRAERPGRVFLQTLQPDFPLFRQVLSYDWDTFVDHEIQRRQAQDCPPITRFTAIILSHKQEYMVQKMADQWQKKCPKHPDIQVFGPAPAPINPLRGRWRWRFLIKANPGAPVYDFVLHWLNTPPVAKEGLVVEIDRDPYCLL
jgi:primosomal protein N' (replication factor Y)